MKQINGDIFKGDWNGICHVANCFHTWGGGFVIPLKRLYPSAYQADLQTEKGYKKLGTFSFAEVSDKHTIFNLYGQVGIGNDGDPLNRNCRYDYIFNSVYRVCQFIDQKYNPTEESPYTLAFPYLIGCGLAGGSIKIVESVLEDVEKRFRNINFVTYRI